MKLIGYVIAEHRHDCRYLTTGRNPWVCPEHKYLTPLNHKLPKSVFAFRCNDPECPAKLGIPTSQMYALWQQEMAHLITKGAPKRRRK